jgi:hypothetical protein
MLNLDGSEVDGETPILQMNLCFPPTTLFSSIPEERKNVYRYGDGGRLWQLSPAICLYILTEPAAEGATSYARAKSFAITGANKAIMESNEYFLGRKLRLKFTQ